MKLYRAAICAAMLLFSRAEALDRELRQSLDDAWWTGPILASSPASAPRGHLMIEPFFYDTITTGQFDRQGALRSSPRTHSARFGSFVLYGLSDRVSIGLIPTFGFNRTSAGSSNPRLGDLSLQVQYQLTEFESEYPIPTTSVLVSSTLPTGRYDRLGSHSEDGLGSGAHTETVSVYSQYYFWLPTGRILRTRLDLSFSMSDRVSLQDQSVYSTPQGFRGHAAPGDAFAVYLAGEYSLTRNWVGVLEVAFQHADSTVITGGNFLVPGGRIEPVEFNTSTGPTASTTVAAEVEYNWSERVGVIAGLLFTVAGRNAAASITPAVSVNLNL